MSISIRADGEDVEDMIMRYVKSRIENQIKFLLEHQLKNIVDGKLAELRLLDPNSPALTGVVEASLGRLIDQHISQSLPVLLSNEMKRKFQNPY